MIIDRHRQRLLGAFLPDDVLAELFINLLGCGNLACLQARLRDGSLLFLDDFSTHVDALITDVDPTRTGYEPLHLILTLATK